MLNPHFRLFRSFQEASQWSVGPSAPPRLAISSSVAATVEDFTIVMATLPQLMAHLLPFFRCSIIHFNYPFFLVGWDWSIYSIYSSNMHFELIHFCSAPFTGMGLDICQFVLPARPSRTAARAGFGSMFADPEPMIRRWVYVCRSVLTFIAIGKQSDDA